MELQRAQLSGERLADSQSRGTDTDTNTDINTGDRDVLRPLGAGVAGLRAASAPAAAVQQRYSLTSRIHTDIHAHAPIAGAGASSALPAQWLSPPGDTGGLASPAASITVAASRPLLGA